uniref:Uncharacterized protein n=1 Tax=uncultured marine virus TaxID=186617 RepID=A0A0F7LAV5_9VIRU|nr:hypothetical protein [uncultured marine virus]
MFLRYCLKSLPKALNAIASIMFLIRFSYPFGIVPPNNSLICVISPFESLSTLDILLSTFLSSLSG